MIISIFVRLLFLFEINKFFLFNSLTIFSTSFTQTPKRIVDITLTNRDPWVVNKNVHSIWQLSILCRVTNGSNKSRLLEEIALVAWSELKLAGRMIRETLPASNFNHRYFRSVLPRFVSRRSYISLQVKSYIVLWQSISINFPSSVNFYCKFLNNFY